MKTCHECGKFIDGAVYIRLGALNIFELTSRDQMLPNPFDVNAQIPHYTYDQQCFEKVKALEESETE